MSAWQPGGRVGDWVLDEPLGQGGMGVVYRCHDARTGRPYALKLLANVANADLRLRFKREGEAQARVDRHPHVLGIHSAGEHAGRPFLVMDLAPGGDLARRIRERGPADPLAAARLGAQLAEGLAHVHAQGVLHRDLKPQNVLFDEHDRPQLVDFGLAHLAGGQSLTEPGELLGTPIYMSPEQAQGRGVDARSDVYGLGAVLYHVVTGRAPYQGKSVMQVLEELGAGPPPAPSVARPGLPADLDHVLRRALARNPARRYPTAAAFAADLRRVAEGQRPARELSLPPAAWAAAGIVVAALGALFAWSERPPQGSSVTPRATPSATSSPSPAASPSPSPTPVEDPAPPDDAAPTVNALLRQLSARVDDARRRPSANAGSLQELRFFLDGAVAPGPQRARDRSLAMLATRLRVKQADHGAELGYDATTVRRLHLAAAGWGDPIALHELGNYLVKFTDRDPRDLAAGYAVLEASSATGFPPAQRLLARELLRSRDPADARKARDLLEAAAPNDRDSLVFLAELLLPIPRLAGLVEPDPERAVRLLQEATKQWSGKAVRLLAQLYLDGDHVDRDPALAIDLLTQAERTQGGRLLAGQLGDALASQDDPACVDAYERGLRRGSVWLTRQCHQGLAKWYAAHGNDDLARRHRDAAAAIAAGGAEWDDDDE